jgi:cobalt-zinc-cadmium efflux system outer membrane protein
MKSRFLSLILLLAVSKIIAQSSSSDTIKITLRECEKQFLDKNLLLLAQKCNVDASKALVIQARLWDNPNITVNQNIYNTENKTNGGNKWFDASNKGETSLQIQQLIYLAGKRNKRINLAAINAQKTEYAFYDFLRTLKFQLRIDFNNLFYYQKNLQVYFREIESLDKIISVFEEQEKKGYVSKNEVLRLKASLFSLENEKTELFAQIKSIQVDLNILLHLNNTYFIPQINTSTSDTIIVANLHLQDLIDTAALNRYDLKAAESDVEYNELNFSLQKATAVPDLNLIAGWDRNGNYVHNYNYIGVQLDLPFFNRNQGNIKNAKYMLDNSKYIYQSAQDNVTGDVVQAYSKVMENEKLYRKFDSKFNDDFTMLIDEVVKNYQKRNISLLEFLDFYDAYKENSIQFNTLQSNRLNGFEELNFSVGKNIIQY